MFKPILDYLEKSYLNTPQIKIIEGLQF
jgi:hypothetical protein